MNPRRDRITRGEFRRATRTPEGAGPRAGKGRAHLAPADPVRPYVYGASNAKLRPVIPEHAAALRVRPPGQAEAEKPPTVRDELEYLQQTAAELLGDLDIYGLDEISVGYLLRSVENLLGLVTAVHVTEESHPA